MKRSQSAGPQQAHRAAGRRSRWSALAVSGASILGAVLLMGGGRSTGPIIESHVEGHVTGIDAKDRTLKLDSQRQPVEVSIRAYVTRDGEPAKLADIQPGDEVRAGYLTGESIHAMRIEARASKQPAAVQPAPASPAAPAQPPPPDQQAPPDQE